MYKALGNKASVPDYRGLFLRGTGGNASAIGVKQGDAIRNITGHWSVVGGGSYGWSGALSGGKIGGTHITAGTTGQGADTVWLDASRVVPTANENRPINTAVKYYIKALN